MYEIYAIEYQWRGLPHFHLVIRLERAPRSENHAEDINFVDEHITCMMSDNEDAAKLQRENMTHKCSWPKANASVTGQVCYCISLYTCSSALLSSSVITII